jgi:hypothetical protein
MSQQYSRGHYLAGTIGLSFAAWFIFKSHVPSPTLAADLKGFRASPTCRDVRLLSDSADAPLAAPVRTSCVIQQVTVTNKIEKLNYTGRSHTTQYWITTRLPWGAQHAVMLRGGRAVYNAVVVGRPLNALLWGDRVALLAVQGQAVSTSDNPDVAHQVQILRWLGVVLLIGMALGSLYRALT